MTRDLLRHSLATVAYRGGRTLRDAPPDFSVFRAAPGSRSAGEILAHMSDLLDWSLSLVRGPQAWHNSTPAAWEQDTARLFTSLAAFDAALASGSTIECSDEQLFQGPIADLLTHIGQIAMLRRLAGAPIRAENYLEADITKGRVGADQAAPRYEFG
jgi:hypothetical protein